MNYLAKGYPHRLAADGYIVDRLETAMIEYNR